jgi:hypothetical protein
MSDKPNETCSSPEKSVPYGLEAAGHGPTVKPSGSLVFTLPHAPFNSLALANSAINPLWTPRSRADASDYPIMEREKIDRQGLAPS